MGIYINTGNAGFESARNRKYVDKSETITIINKTLFTEFRYSCVTLGTGIASIATMIATIASLVK